MANVDTLVERGCMTLRSQIATHSQVVLDAAARNVEQLVAGHGWGGGMTTKIELPDVEEYTSGQLEECIAALMDDARVRGAHVITSAPYAKAGGWHVDSDENRGEGLRPAPIEAGRPLTLAVLWPVDAFTVENGATVVCPPGHDEGRAASVPLVGEPGDASIFLATICRHQRGVNTTNRTRSGLFVLIAGRCTEWFARRMATSSEKDNRSNP